MALWERWQGIVVNGVEAEVDADVDAFVDADLWTWSRRRGCKADGRRGADPLL